jgi:hypothetical protein
LNRRRGALLGLVAVLAAGAALAETKRVQKRGAGGIRHVFWVEQIYGRSDGAVHVTALPAVLEVGDVFEIVDQGGRWGRVQVESVEEMPLGCGNQGYRRGLALPTSSPPRALSAPSVALGPSQRTLDRAVLLGAEQVKRKVEPLRPDVLERIFVDLDGDGDPDLFRQYYYCEGSGRGTTYCVESWARQGESWRKLESMSFMSC